MVQTSKETHIDSMASAAAKKLHPEDLRVGDDVALSETVYQYPSFCWDDASSVFGSKEQPVQIAFQSAQPFEAYKVVGLCLPFVMVADRKDKTQVFDLRLTRLFRLSTSFADSFRKRKNKQSKSNSKKKRKNR